MGSRSAWITPDTIPADTICRALLIPNDPVFYANVVGALLPLCYVDNWEQVGAVTPAQAVAAAKIMFDAFVQSTCIGLQMDIFRDEHATGVAGASIAANTNTKMAFQTADSFNEGLCTIDGNGDHVINTPGLYHVSFWHSCNPGNAKVKCWLGDTGQSPFFQGKGWGVASSNERVLQAEGMLRVSIPPVAIRGYARSTGAVTGFFGIPFNVATFLECYGTLTVARIAD